MSDAGIEFDPKFDAYKALGVDRSATKEQIKKAYFKLAQDNHPDRHPGDKAAEKRFKEASKAYSYLGDPDTRKRYDGFAGQVRETVRDVVTNPRVKEILNQASKVMGSRTPGTVPERPHRERPERPGPARNPVQERADRLRTERPTSSSTRPAPGSMMIPKGNDPKQLIAYAFAISKSIRQTAADGDIRDQDRLILPSGTVYTFRRVLYTNPGDPNQYRTVHPVLCRGTELLADLALSPKQGLKVASPETCRLFAGEINDVAKALMNLISQRDLSQPMARELRSIMASDETVQFNGHVIRPRTLPFIKNGQRINTTVMCADMEVLEVQPGDPADPRFRYADGPTARMISGNYLALRGMAAAQAKAKGRDVPAFTHERVRNTVRATADRVGDWLG